MTATLNGHDMHGTTAHRPVNAEAGQPYYDTDLGKLVIWSGSAWEDAASGASFSEFGSLLRSTIDPNDTLVGYDASAAGNFKISLQELLWALKEYPGSPELFIDPNDKSTMELMPAANFTAAGPFLTVADSGTFGTALSAIAANGTFTYCFWRSPNWLLSGSNLAGIDQCYGGQLDETGAGKNAWGVVSGGGAGTGNDLRIFGSTTGAALAWSIKHTATDGTGAGTYGKPFSFGVASYNNVRTAADKARFYKDGVLIDPATYAVDFGTPGAIFDGTGSFRIGKFGTTDPDLLNQCINRVLLFNRELTAAEVAYLNNLGEGWWFRDLKRSGFDMTGLVGAWDCDERSGTRYDRSGNGGDLAESGGTIPAADLVMELRDLSKNRYVWYPPKGSKYSGGDAAIFSEERGMCHAPRWSGSDSTLNNTASLKFSGQAMLYSRGASPFNLTAADIFNVIYYNTITAADEVFTLFTSGEIDDLKYYGVGRSPSGGTARPWIRMRDASGPGTTGIHADNAIAAATLYIDHWRILGTGTNASYEHYLNNVANDISSGSYDSAGAKNTCFASVNPRDNVTLGSLSRSTGNSIASQDWQLGMLLVYNGLSSARATIIRNILRAIYGT